MATDEVTIKVDRKKLIVVIVFLLLLLIFFCVTTGGKRFGWPLGAGTQTPEDNQTDSGETLKSVKIDPSTFFEEPFFFDTSSFAKPVPASLLMATRIQENVVMYTFELPQSTFDANYTAKINLPDGSAKAYKCDTLEEYPDRVYCYGAPVQADLELTVTLFAANSSYSVGNVISANLLDAKAENLHIDWSPYNVAAANMGLDLIVDNPFEAWNVIGCCVMNSAGELPAGCESLPVGDNEVPDFFGMDQFNDEGKADAVWNGMMNYALAPTDWSPEYNGEKIDEETLLAKANACSDAFGGVEVGNIGEARAFYNLVKRFDTRVDNDRSWGAELADSITDFFDTYFGWLTDPSYWEEVLTDFGKFNLWEFLSNKGKEIACLGISGAMVFDEDIDYPSWCPTGSSIGSDDENLVTTNYSVDDLLASPMPDACLEYIDYANSETYFLLGSSYFGGYYSATYCIDALEFDVDARPVLNAAVGNNYQDQLYDALIENYGYVGNPAMPDACKTFVDWCDSDQLKFMGEGFTGPLVEGSYIAVNGCNDPDNYQERATWSANLEPPDCSAILEGIDSGESGISGIYDAIRDAYEAGSPYVINTYCYQVWSERENFNNTPVGQVKSCAEAIKYNKPLNTVADYMDFLTFMGALGGLYKEDYASNYPGCQEALDWAYWFGLTQQGINAAGTTCDEGGPSQATEPLIFINPATFYSQPGNNNNNDKGGGACTPPQAGCPFGEYWEPNTCNCEIIN